MRPVDRVLPGAGLVDQLMSDGAQLDVAVGGGSDKEREGAIAGPLVAPCASAMIPTAIWMRMVKSRSCPRCTS